MSELTTALREAVGRLPDGLRDHVLRVEKEAAWLADRHSVDKERILVAVLAHDLARAEPDVRLLELAETFGIEVGEAEGASPILLHGPVGARILERDYGVGDAEVLAAIAAHTTASPNMTLLQKTVFIADKIEPDKVARKPELAEVAGLAAIDFDAALLRFLDLHLLEAVERGWLLHPSSVATRNRLLTERGTSD
jgi:predicted HD superfamily hydrolase involved in NAD metabolism